jgi:DNA-binding HxlR family transcriptional regulator
MKSNYNSEMLAMEKDPYRFVINTFMNRWKPYILRALDFDEITRFNKFTRQLPVSEKVLAANLRELIADGLIFKTIYPEVPPRVEYRLTKQGVSVCKILDAIYEWGWYEMKRRELPINPLGEMWHGYREKDADLMKDPYKTKTK